MKKISVIQVSEHINFTAFEKSRAEQRKGKQRTVRLHRKQIWKEEVSAEPGAWRRGCSRVPASQLGPVSRSFLSQTQPPTDFVSLPSQARNKKQRPTLCIYTNIGGFPLQIFKNAWPSIMELINFVLIFDFII